MGSFNSYPGPEINPELKQQKEIRQKINPGENQVISRLINSVYYFIDCVYILESKNKYRLVALHHRRVLFDKYYPTHSPDRPEPKRTRLVREITNYKSQITNMGCPSDRFKRLRRGVLKFFLNPIGLFVISDIVIWKFIFCHFLAEFHLLIIRGCRIAFQKTFKDRAWQRETKAHWSPFYDPDKRWLDEKQSHLES